MHYVVSGIPEADRRLGIISCFQSYSGGQCMWIDSKKLYIVFISQNYNIKRQQTKSRKGEHKRCSPFQILALHTSH